MTISDRHFNDDGDTVASTEDGECGEAFLHRYCQTWAVNIHTAMEQMAMIANHLGADDSCRYQAVDEVRRMKSLISRGHLQIHDYVKCGGCKELAERCLWLLLDFPELAGAGDIAGIVRLTRKKKQTVDKCLRFFQDKIPELPPIPGQRNDESRKLMATVQTKIWSGQKQKNNQL